jgi:flagellar biosynthesis protein FliP
MISACRCAKWLFFLVFLMADAEAFADLKANSFLDETGFLNLKNQLRIIGFLTLVSFIPFGVMMMTSFLRISIVFQFLRQALGSSQVPSNQIIIGLSLILTGFIMQPVIQQIQTTAIQPYMNGNFLKLPEVKSGSQTEESILIERAWQPLQTFLSSHIREKDLQLFLDIAHKHLQKVDSEHASNADEMEQEYDMQQVPWYCIIPAFMLSELRTAFMMGFLLFLPFLIIDMVVAAVLMSMGMMMLPPIMVSTPFKLLLFIMIDGWHLIVQQIINGFHSIS